MRQELIRQASINRLKAIADKLFIPRYPHQPREEIETQILSKLGVE